MVKWKEETVIDANIEKVWELFLDRNIRRIFPKLEGHVLLEGNDDQKGAKHTQSYFEGKQLLSYIVETTVFEDEPNRKQRTTQFMMGQSIFVVYSFLLEKVSEEKTRFVYSGMNKGMTASAKMMLLAGSKKARQATILSFMERVKAEALKK